MHTAPPRAAIAAAAGAGLAAVVLGGVLATEQQATATGQPAAAPSGSLVQTFNASGNTGTLATKAVTNGHTSDASIGTPGQVWGEQLVGDAAPGTASATVARAGIGKATITNITATCHNGVATANHSGAQDIGNVHVTYGVHHGDGSIDGAVMVLHGAGPKGGESTAETVIVAHVQCGQAAPPPSPAPPPPGSRPPGQPRPTHPPTGQPGPTGQPTHQPPVGQPSQPPYQVAPPAEEQHTPQPGQNPDVTG
jgi:hypothetical protein